MSELAEKFRFADPWYVRRVVVEREFYGGPLSLELTITDDQSTEVVRLVGTTEEDAVSYLLEAERLTISEEIGSQRNFGTIQVECFGETFAEFWCDAVELQNNPVQNKNA